MTIQPQKRFWITMNKAENIEPVTSQATLIATHVRLRPRQSASDDVRVLVQTERVL